jgi:lipoprotein-anchoring transpeptidase ErfK/SrfK
VLNKGWIRPALIATAVATVALTAAAYAYDSSRSDRIAKGITVAGIDVSGLSRESARKRLAAELAPRLQRPVRVAAARHLFRLTPRRSAVKADVDAMVDAAIAKSRRGWLFGRFVRGTLNGDRVEAELLPQVTYSGVAVRRFVSHVKHSVDRPPRNASLKLQVASLPAIPSRTGLKVNRSRLLASVQTALAGLGPARSVHAKVRVKRPKLTTRELGKKYPAFVTIDRPAFRLRFFKHLKLKKTYTIAVGRVGLETPAGVYHIQSKQVNPSWHVPNSAWAGELAGKVIPPGPDDPLKARWMGFFDGAGIHGTDAIGSLGTAASHGCIRMSIPDVEALYDMVPLSTPVYVQ